MPETNKPVRVFHAGKLKLAVWANQSERDGETFVRHSATLSKRYRDKDGQWHDTDTLFTEDLFRVAMLAQRAAVWMDLKELSPADEAGAT